MLVAVVIGFLSGLRSLAPLAVVAFAVHAGWLAAGGLAWLGGSIVMPIVVALAVGELIADKLPSTPARTAPPGLVARIVAGAVAGACVAGAAIGGAVVGAVAAVIGTFAGYHARRTLTASAGLPDLPVALLEDAVTIAAAFWVVSRG